ncbi:MAG: response regulator transcription factor [Acidimicrobiales bacterium]|nr:response regulator transcription factor [Acidimicrobiales bacterium]
MPRVLLATDADWIHEEVDAALGGDDIDVVRIKRGVEVRPTVQGGGIDLVVLDLQIGNMGGMAACMELRLDESVDLIERVPVLMLLDRDVDAFLAKRSEADGWLVKPINPFDLRRAATALLDGDEWKPEPGGPVIQGEIDEIDDGLAAEEAEADAQESDPTADDVTADGDQLADPATEPGADEAAERASEVKGP